MRRWLGPERRPGERAEAERVRGRGELGRLTGPSGVKEGRGPGLRHWAGLGLVGFLLFPSSFLFKTTLNSI